MAVVSIGAALAELARRDPDRPAVVVGDRTVTRAQLDRAGRALAAELIASGVRVDDIVPLTTRDPVDTVLACCAVWTAGATPMPLDPATGPGRLAEVVGLTGARHVLDLLPALEELLTHPLPVLPDLHATSWKATSTGGSSGPPKVVVSARPALVDPDRPAVAFAPADGPQLVPAALHHSAQSTYALRGLMCGQTLVALPSFDPEAVLSQAALHRVTWMLLTPPLMTRIWRLGPDARATHDLAALEAVVHVGARCPDLLKRDWIDWLGPDRVVEVYSSTESTGVTVIGGLDWLAHPGSVGRPVSGAYQVRGPDGLALPAGTVGEVWVRPDGGPGSTYRHLGGTARTAGEWESVGDLGRLDADGFLYLVDRAADTVVVAGVAVHPADVEAVLESHPAVRSAGAVGVPDPDTGQRVHAVLDTAGSPVEVSDLVAWAAARLPAEAVPRTVRVVDGPVRDDAGKVRRSTLPDT